MAETPSPTLPITTSEPDGNRQFRRFVVEVVSGSEKGARWHGDGESCAIGSQPDNDLCLADATVSRYHCEVTASGTRFRIRDLGSRNGVRIGSVHVTDATVAAGTELRLGHATVRITVGDDDGEVEAAKESSFGSLVGESAPMREAFAKLARAAGANATVLIEGETGTGKDGAAEAIHAGSERADGPLVVFDCGAVPPNLSRPSFLATRPAPSPVLPAPERAHSKRRAAAPCFSTRSASLPSSFSPSFCELSRAGALSVSARAKKSIATSACSRRPIATSAPK